MVAMDDTRETKQKILQFLERWLSHKGLPRAALLCHEGVIVFLHTQMVFVKRRRDREREREKGVDLSFD